MEKTCFFIGHRDAPDSLAPELDALVERHIVEYGVGEFVVGRYGGFDALAASAVKRAKVRHPDVRLVCLRPYHPAERPEKTPSGFDGSFYPPEDGYRLDVLKVTSNGKSVPLTEKGGGKYTFTMPAGTVKVEATFVPAETPETPWGNPFADVSESAWYYDAVRFVSENGLMGGYGNGQFGVNDNLSRAQLAQILFNKEGRPVVNYLLQYGDVSTGTWYTEAVRWATSQGIVGGYGNGTFGPNDPITREQLAVMLWRYSGSPAATNKELHFNDTDEISGFALEAMRWAVENGVIGGYGNGQLGPQGLATRAQVTQMLKNFLENRESGS